MKVDDLINNAEHIGSSPDMYHPEYGWIRVDGILTEAGKKYFEDKSNQVEEKFEGKPRGHA